MSEIAEKIRNWNCEDINELTALVEKARIDGFDTDFFDAWANVPISEKYEKYICARCSHNGDSYYCIHTVDNTGTAWIVHRDHYEKIVPMSELNRFELISTSQVPE